MRAFFAVQHRHTFTSNKNNIGRIIHHFHKRCVCLCWADFRSNHKIDNSQVEMIDYRNAAIAQVVKDSDLIKHYVVQTS